ncbi:tRNA pseudouridine(65) synthase [Saliniradius amylolyticus]|uniref:tRNA pseudouridine synthase C n=2 Tax=Saliniradius amylolyticus TaxID=2183582 RepID=A0A2S2E4M9_9ALTE|nr:tRNA pseudouridine(65) synthase [Saliniradius amylolyticus]
MLPLLYQDEYMVAVHKPAGLLVHRSLIDRHETEFAMQQVRDQIGQRVFTVHRLDKPTSGVLLMGLSSEAARRLTELFTSGQVDKTYRAMVRGFAPAEGLIDRPLKEKLDKLADKKARQDKPPQEARTRYRTLYQFELPFAVDRYATARYSYLELYPETGRKHQLRRHLSHINHPIVGDVNHGDNKQNRFLREQFGFQGLALTATRLSLPHPFTGDKLTLESDYDGRIDKLLAQWHSYRHSQDPSA